jgi:hypothetical protein
MNRKGPWNFVNDDDGGIVFDRDMEKVADTYSMEDARLIAAAPDMLAALQSAIDVLDGLGPDDIDLAVNIIVRAAIAKATGEA